MDTKTIIKKLNSIFCENNRGTARYSKVWLTDVDFGGLYSNDMFVLNVQAEHEITSCKEEIRSIIDLLDQKAKEELQHIWAVTVYNADEQPHCSQYDVIVLDEEKKCAIVNK